MDFETNLRLLLTMWLLKFCIIILLQVYGSQGMECGSLNVIGPHNLIGSGTIRRCDLVGGSVLLWGQVSRFLILGILPSVTVDFLLPTKCRTLSYSSTTSARMPPFSLSR